MRGPRAGAASYSAVVPDSSWRRDRRATRGDLRHDAIARLVEPLLPGADLPGALVVDLGGGTGTLSVELASGGGSVLVVDPSADALAALARRAREAGVADRVRGVQGDASVLAQVCDRPVDLLLCHDVLELVDDPVATLADVAASMRPGAPLSLLSAQRSGAAALRAGVGRIEEALALLADPHGRTGPDDVLLRRMDADRTAELLAGAGFDVVSVVGVPVLADLVPEAVLDSGPRVRETLRRLEAAASSHPDLRGLASHLHWHAVRR